MWSIFALLALSSVQGENWISGGDHTNKDLIETRPLTVTRGTDSGSIRIAFDVSALTGALLTAVSDVTPNVDNYLRNTVKVLNIAQPWGSPSFFCAGKDYPLFNLVEHDFYVIFDVYTGPNTEIFTGISSTCHIENSAKSNALGGVIQLSPSFASLDKYRRWTYVLHEVIHLLAFSEVLATKWENLATSSKYTAAELTTTLTIRGLNKRLLKTPKVLDKIRTAFNDNTLEGAELEEFQDFGRNLNINSISHWDARVLHNDIMVIRSISEMIISTVTLAVLEDSGWYTVNYKHAQVPIVGRNDGCKFTKEKCVISKNSNSRKIWCTVGIPNACDTFGLNKGSCNFNGQCLINNAAQSYFGNAKIGGRDFFEDFCPYVETKTDGSCRDQKTGNSDEIYGQTSRCFEHTLHLTSTETRSLSQKTSCWQVKCDTPTGTYIVIMKRATGTAEFTCPDEGGLVYYTETIGSAYHSGWIKCPARSVVCGDAPCTAVCLGNGYCDVNTCKCFDGYSGAICDRVCDTGCTKCTKEGCCLICKDGTRLEDCKCVPCSSNCKLCDTTTGCTECDPNYKKVLDPVTGKYICEPICADNCPKCTTPGGCIIPDGKCLNSEGVQTDCCGNCDKCNFIKCCECLVCKTGFFLTSINTCTKECAVYCKTCATIYECAECLPGFILNSDKKCERCPKGCKTCDDLCPATCVDGTVTLTCNSQDCFGSCETCASVVCTQCHPDHVMNEITKECIRKCPENCRICDILGVCTHCNLRFYLDVNKVCKPCEAGCFECYPGTTEDYTICGTCASGYFLTKNNPVYPDDADCLNCMPGCSSCKESKICFTCVCGWYLDLTYNTNTCIQCEYGCRICDQTCCAKPHSGFYISNCKVYRCNKACSTCDVDQICNTCIAGYFFYQCTSTNCLCRYCEPNCARCSGPIECVVCRCGYYLGGVNECILCRSNCYDCYNGEKCYRCRGGYYLDVEKQCKPCGEGCCHCVTGNNCLSCAAGWWPNEFACQRCPANCSLCWSASDCYACKTGWYLYDCHGCPSSPGGECKRCLTNCVKCQAEYMCTLCSRGYFVSSGVCEKCGLNCAFCVSAEFCTICNTGWYLAEDKTCVKCAEGCLDCCDEWTCLKAKPGYFLKNVDITAGTEGAPPNLIEVVATKCSSDCCRCTGLGACTLCGGSYYINSGYCSKCPDKCTSCDNPATCKTCVSFYFVNGGECQACAPFCNKCDISGCLIPKSGYYIDTDPNTFKKIPVPCQSPCNHCVGLGTYHCINCRCGFGLESSPDPLVKTYKCTPCPRNCYMCTTSNFCKTANNGYYAWTDGTVYQCSSDCNQCTPLTTASTPTSVCKTCRTGYGVNNNICEKCPAFCINCSNGKCNTCNAGYFTNLAFGCSLCDSSCFSCEGNAFKCTKCKKGFYLSNNSCLMCIPKCLSCNDGNSCLTCQAGHVFVPDPACAPCMPGCAKCQDQTSCDVSLPGSYLDIEYTPFISLSCASAKGANCKTCSKRLKNGIPLIECFTCHNRKLPPNCA